MKYVVICMLSMLIISSGCISENAVREVDALQVPVLLFLTGNQAAIGEEILNAIMLAEEDFEAMYDIDVEILIEDTGDEAVGAINAFQKLQSKDHFPLYVVTGDTVASGVLPLFEQHDVTMMATTVSAPQTSSDHMFRGFFTSSAQARELGEHIGLLGHDRIGLLTLRNPFSIGFEQGLRDGFTPYGDVAAVEFYNIVATDVKTQLIKIDQQGVDALVVAGFGPAYPMIFRQIKEIGLRIDVFASHAIGTPYYYNAAGGAEVLDGVQFWSTAFDHTKKQEGKLAEFYERFNERFGMQPSFFSGYAYDSMIHVLHALKDCPTKINKEFRECLSKQELDGLLGTNSFDEERNMMVHAEIRKFEGN